MSYSQTQLLPRTIESLLQEKHDHHQAGQLLDIQSGDQDAYNVSSPFIYEGKEYIFARLEARKSDRNTVSVVLEHNQSGSWTAVQDFDPLPLQDPFVKKVHDKWVAGGVRYYPDRPGSGNWETHIYTGNSPFDLEPYLVGPYGMKDVRLFPMNDGRVGVLTRPQGKVGGLGKVGIYIANSLDEVNAEDMTKAPIINELFDHSSGEWGGASDAYDLGGNDGYVGIIGHIARRVYNPQTGRYDREYYGHSWVLNLGSLAVCEESILACRECFPATEAKYPDLGKVVFPGGVRVENKRNVVYCGLNDVAAGKVTVELPFAVPEADT